MIKKIAGVAVAVAPLSAFAAPVDLSTLTAAVDLTTVTAGILAVAALMMVPQVAKYATATLRRMFPK